MVLSCAIPEWGELIIHHVVFDLNGTLARDGVVAATTRERLTALAGTLSIHVISADTHGTLAQVMTGLPVRVQRLEPGPGAVQKRIFLESLGVHQTVAVGNGRNDVSMIEAAALGIAVLGPEGAAREVLLAADLVFNQIDDVLDSLINPRRLMATLRG